MSWDVLEHDGLERYEPQWEIEVKGDSFNVLQVIWLLI
jgi:hypothetical protein